LLIYQG